MNILILTLITTPVLAAALFALPTLMFFKHTRLTNRTNTFGQLVKPEKRANSSASDRNSGFALQQI